MFKIRIGRTQIVHVKISIHEGSAAKKLPEVSFHNVNRNQGITKASSLIGEVSFANLHNFRHSEATAGIDFSGVSIPSTVVALLEIRLIPAFSNNFYTLPSTVSSVVTVSIFVAMASTFNVQ